MSEKIGAVSVLPSDGPPTMAGTSNAMLDLVDQEVHRISQDCLVEARRLLRENRDKLDGIVKELLARETLDEQEVYAAAGVDRPAKARGPNGVEDEAAPARC